MDSGRTFEEHFGLVGAKAVLRGRPDVMITPD